MEGVDCCCLWLVLEAEPTELMLSGVPGLSAISKDKLDCVMLELCNILEPVRRQNKRTMKIEMYFIFKF